MVSRIANLLFNMEIMLQDDGRGDSRVETAKGHTKSTEPDFGKVNLAEFAIKKKSNRSHRRRQVGCNDLRGAGEVSAGDLVFSGCSDSVRAEAGVVAAAVWERLAGIFAIE